ncbi:MAG: hypothetical protein JSS81_24550 [Acidobacteria bacterium]|nr:hypothetical protein [Acidobacteriota bacterium]
MKKTIFLATFVCLLAISAFAQDKKTDFSGTWSLDKTKSQLDQRMQMGVESMTLTVAQTDKDIKVTTETKRTPPPDGAMQGGGGQGNGQGGGQGRGMGRGGFGDGTNLYTLDGKETTTEVDGPMGKMPVKLKAEMEKDGKLKLTSVRTFSGQMGEITLTTKETWSLSEDGKTLTVKRDSESPRGTNSSEMVFTKK